MKNSLVFSVTVAIACLLPQPARPQQIKEKTFNINDPNGRDWVAFENSALLESITGSGNDVKGQVIVDPILPQAVAGTVRFRIGSLHTGIEGRDEKLVSAEWFDATKYPYAVFHIASASKFSVGWLEDRQTVTCEVTGDMTILNHTEPFTTRARVTYFKEGELTKTLAPGDLLKVEAPFEIDLSRYGLDVEKLAPNKVSNKVSVKVAFVAATGHKVPEGQAALAPAPPTPTPPPPQPVGVVPPTPRP